MEGHEQPGRILTGSTSVPQLWGAVMMGTPGRITLVRDGLAALHGPALDAPVHSKQQLTGETVAALHLDAEQVVPPHVSPLLSHIQLLPLSINLEGNPTSTGGLRALALLSFFAKLKRFGACIPRQLASRKTSDVA